VPGRQQYPSIAGAAAVIAGMERPSPRIAQQHPGVGAILTACLGASNCGDVFPL